jgi:hypothetical protein
VFRTGQWKVRKGFFRRGLPGNELTLLVKGLDEILFIGVIMVVFFGGLNTVIKWPMGAYSCRLCRICWAYAQHILHNT